MGEHTSLRPYVQTADEAYAVLQTVHASEGRQLHWWQLGTIALLVAGLAIAGPVGKTALCLAAMAGMRWLVHLVDYMGRGWYMHYLTLRDLTHPPTVSWDLITGLAACIPRVPPEGAGEGVETGAPDDTPPLH